MSESKRGFFPEFTAALVAEGLIALGVAASSAIGARLLTLHVAWLAPYVPALMFAAGAVGGIAGFWFFNRLSKSRPRFDKLDFDFDVEDQRITYRYRDDSTIQYVKLKKLRALKDGLSVYHDKYHWTGDEPPASLTCRQDEQTVRETGRHTVWHQYEIHLGRVLSKGDVVETELIWELDDSAHRSVPFVSATVEEPTKSLSFELVFPEHLGVRVVTCSVSTSISAKKPFVSKTLTVGTNGTVSWTPERPHPRLLHQYQVEWIFPDRKNLR